ncbi:MAG: citrate lyase acyl carrier protein [Salinivirgaceae bacterium]|nr:MAG: citrate lyase acyl carrier protein [Salinivirgaceae bacterium]
MQPVHKAQAGTFESSDIMILIEPLDNDGDNHIELSSSVGKQFKDQINRDITELLQKYEITGARIIAKDKGALSPTIKARVETAVLRSLDKQQGTLK